MKWVDVTIVDGENRRTGQSARRYVMDRHKENVSDRVREIVVLKRSDGRTVTDTLTVKAILRDWFGSRVLFASDSEVALPPLAPVRRAETNVIRRDPPLLQMFLKAARDLDGDVDAEPARNEDWTWGADGLGAVLVVTSREWEEGDNVLERSPLDLKWTNNDQVTADWEGTLAVDHADRIRVYRARTAGAELLLGGAVAGPLDLKADAQISAALGRKERVRLWMEAVGYPESGAETDWKVMLTLSFTCAGQTTAQAPVLRIAPWIMGSDLNPSDRVFVRITQGAEDPLAQAVAQFAGDTCERFEVAAGQPSKGFARDVMKSGFTSGPHYSGVVIQSRLDRSPLEALPARAAEIAGGATIVKPDGSTADGLGGQDNGGNLLVSPPAAQYPWGRIVLGGDDGDYPCHSEAFYRAQKVQRPIRVDSTWLRVGHADEMLSFVRCADRTYRALLISPRLAYIMLQGVRYRTDATAEELIAWAAAVNGQCVGAGRYTPEELAGALGDFGALDAPNPPPTFHGVDHFDGAPEVPPHSDRQVVFRVMGMEFAGFLRGSPLVGQAMRDYSAAFPEGRDAYELRVHVRRFLDRANEILLDIIGEVQPILDDTRTLLREQLGFTNEQIIDVPVLLNREAGKCVALTGDSVNLLQLAGDGASNCLVPKPFGPVYAGEYVYERYLADRFRELGVTTQFLADDKFHVMEGEIHCGTNQTHPPLVGPLQKWWHWVRPDSDDPNE